MPKDVDGINLLGIKAIFVILCQCDELARVTEVNILPQ